MKKHNLFKIKLGNYRKVLTISLTFLLLSTVMVFTIMSIFKFNNMVRKDKNMSQNMVDDIKKNIFLMEKESITTLSSNKELQHFIINQDSTRQNCSKILNTYKEFLGDDAIYIFDTNGKELLSTEQDSTDFKDIQLFCSNLSVGKYQRFLLCLRLILWLRWLSLFGVDSSFYALWLGVFC